jgi:site-specific DNA recombinase
MVLLERIELSTSPLPRECSTSELQQRREGDLDSNETGRKGYLDAFFPLL